MKYRPVASHMQTLHLVHPAEIVRIHLFAYFLMAQLSLVHLVQLVGFEVQSYVSLLDYLFKNSCGNGKNHY